MLDGQAIGVPMEPIHSTNQEMMMKNFVMLIAAVALLAATACAQTEVCESGEDCDAKCSIATNLDQLPTMTYKVGDETTCCSASANALAKENDAEVLFLVADKEYGDMAEAMTALADVTEEYVDTFTTPTTCSVSGTTTLAGHQMNCSESAGKLAENMKSAMENVQLAYTIGDESCDCPNQAKMIAEEKGEKMLFVVGDESTCCPVDARIKVAHAKFRAALDVFAKANQPSDIEEAINAES
jgi:hypothetical protein